MNIVNLVNGVDPVSIGVWKAAVWTAPTLLADYGISTHLWAKLSNEWKAEDHSVASAQDISQLSRHKLRTQFLSRFSPGDTIVVSHGAWKFPAPWGADFARLGFPWVHVPQGMLEPWSLQQKAIRKRLYWQAVERRCIGHAAVIRAVSSSEKENLVRLLPDADVRLIPNGIQNVSSVKKLPSGKTTFLFLGRLHKKKGVTELTEGFCKTSRSKDPKVELIIAGPDQGELPHIQSVQRQYPHANIRCVGPVHGPAKEKLLEASQFFVLPSHSEGFPTSVVEAMGAGCIPIISEGCNFPEARQNDVCVSVKTTVDSICDGIEKALAMSEVQRAQISSAARSFIERHYTAKPIAATQAELFHELISAVEIRKQAAA